MDSGGSHQPAGAPISDVLVADDPVFTALEAAVGAVLDTSLNPASGNAAAAVLMRLERQARRIRAAQVEVMNQIDHRGLHHTDGHASVQIQARHVAKLSNGEASARSKTMRMLRALPKLKDAFWAGDIGIDQIQLLARVYANPRVRAAMELRQDKFIHQAQTLHYSLFETRVREWERLIDEDGPEPANERTHEKRTANMSQSPIDLDWELIAKFAAMQGAQFNDIFQHYIDAEWQADWDKAVAEHGGNATTADMPRTDAQRRADALWQMAQDAAGADSSAVPPGFVHNIEWSAETYEEMLRRMSGEDPRPLDPDTYKCQTGDGVPLEPTEAAANSLLHAFRRVVINAKSVTLDMGQKRFFTGAVRDAINIQAGTTCVWPGCHVPTSRCEADHLLEHSKQGRTCPGNGAPLCGRHNRWKQKGYQVRRAPNGTWTTTRPDGTTIDN